jgi:hypothetical protein
MGQASCPAPCLSGGSPCYGRRCTRFPAPPPGRRLAARNGHRAAGQLTGANAILKPSVSSVEAGCESCTPASTTARRLNPPFTRPAHRTVPLRAAAALPGCFCWAAMSCPCESLPAVGSDAGPQWRPRSPLCGADTALCGALLDRHGRDRRTSNPGGDASNPRPENPREERPCPSPPTGHPTRRSRSRTTTARRRLPQPCRSHRCNNSLVKATAA